MHDRLLPSSNVRRNEGRVLILSSYQDRQSRLTTYSSFVMVLKLGRSMNPMSASLFTYTGVRRRRKQDESASTKDKVRDLAEESGEKEEAREYK